MDHSSLCVDYLKSHWPRRARRQIILDCRSQVRWPNSRAISVARLEKMNISCGCGRDLMQRRDVVDDPKRPALRGHDQIVVMKFNIGHRNVRQIQLKWLPVSPVVE